MNVYFAWKRFSLSLFATLLGVVPLGLLGPKYPVLTQNGSNIATVGDLFIPLIAFGTLVTIVWGCSLYWEAQNE